MTATARRPRLTVRQQIVLDRLTVLSTGVYYSTGGWVPRTCIGLRGALEQLVHKGLVETTTARGPLGNDRPVYRPLVAAVDHRRETAAS